MKDHTTVLQNRYHQAKMSIHDRNAKLAAVIESLERDMELLCLTGVEDKLQEGVKPTLELLRNAGIKVSYCLNLKFSCQVQAATTPDYEA